VFVVDVAGCCDVVVTLSHGCDCHGSSGCAVSSGGCAVSSSGCAMSSSGCAVSSSGCAVWCACQGSSSRQRATGGGKPDTSAPLTCLVAVQVKK
jgi:hypothetical protein